MLLTTGYNEELVADGPRATASEVLGKPYSRTQLADRVRAALNAKKRGDRQPSPARPLVDGPTHEG